MKTVWRIAIELLVPPVVAGTTMSLAALFIAPRDWPGAVLFFVVSAVILGGVPTLLYAVLMESCFALGVRPGGTAALVLSALIGALSSLGSALIAVGGSIEAIDSWAFIVHPLLGAFSGSVVWYLVARASGLRPLRREV